MIEVSVYCIISIGVFMVQVEERYSRGLCKVLLC